VPYVRTVKTSSGAVAVQIVYSCHRGSRQIEHIGSAHDDAELELLKSAARQRLAAGQGVLELGPGFGSGAGGPLPITSSRMGVLLDALDRGYEVLGLAWAAGGDEVFRQLVLARIIEPVRKLDSFRMSRHDLQARPVYHHQRDSIEAHLTIVFAALAVSRWIEQQTGWSIRKFVKTARRYRTIQIQAGDHVITAADPLPEDLRDVLSKISNAQVGAH